MLRSRDGLNTIGCRPKQPKNHALASYLDANHRMRFR